MQYSDSPFLKFIPFMIIVKYWLYSLCCTAYPRSSLCSVCCLQFTSVAQSGPTLCDPMDCSTPGLPVHHQLHSLLKLIAIESVMPSNHLILCRPLLLSPSISQHQLFASGGQSIGVSASTSVLLVNTQD